MGNSQQVDDFEREDMVVLVGDFDTESTTEGTKIGSVAIMDGLNVAYSRNDHHARLGDLVKIENVLNKHFDRVETFVDASGLYTIDNRKILEDMITKGKIVLCPARIRADDLIWTRGMSLANKGVKVWIVTNDMFPVNRSQGVSQRLRNLTVTMMRTGDVYLLEREIKYPNANLVLAMKAESTGDEEVSQRMAVPI